MVKYLLYFTICRNVLKQTQVSSHVTCLRRRLSNATLIETSQMVVILLVIRDNFSFFLVDWMNLSIILSSYKTLAGSGYVCGIAIKISGYSQRVDRCNLISRNELTSNRQILTWEKRIVIKRQRLILKTDKTNVT